MKKGTWIEPCRRRNFVLRELDRKPLYAEVDRKYNPS